MNKLPSSAVTAGLIGAGALAWALSARPVATSPELAAPLNPFGLNRSPYGEVIAMAMQSPIDNYWHAAEGADHQHGPECGPDCDHDHDTDHDHDATPDHVCDAGCDHDHDHHDAAPAPKPAATPTSLRNRFVAFISGIDRGVSARNNPKPISPAHRFYMRRQAEDKLRFAYYLDPAHYSNFNSYYFFLTQSAVGTRPELTSSAVKLAQDTIDYCLAQEDDPRPALTAAAAAENILEQMLTEHSNGTREHDLNQMRQNLALVDLCIHRFVEIAARWDATGNWDRLSDFRLTEIKDRIHFIRKVRDTMAVTLNNLSKLPGTHQVSK